MNKKISSIFAILVIFLIGSFITFLFIQEINQGNISNGESVSQPKGKNKASTQMANPASVYCEQNEGKLEIRTADDGGQAGYCKFSDGTECEEWAYFRGECKKIENFENKDWKIYRNDKYGYELQYPSNFSLDEDESNISIDKDPIPGQGGFIGFTGEYNGDTVAVSLNTSGNYLTKCENSLIKKITIDSREVKICRDDRLNMFYSVIPRNDIAKDSEKMSDYVFISANGNLNKKQNTEKLFELILSTFKFL